MSVFLFIVILVVLIVGHEFGHFIVAKLSGMKVPEFGLGFQPKLWGKKFGETEYTLNVFPLGGFVKIEGEEPPVRVESGSDGREHPPQDDARAFYRKPKYAQALTLFAGPFANIFIAFLLSSAAFMAGVPAAADSGYPPKDIRDAHVRVVEVLPGSPAEHAGVKVGDRIVSVTANGIVNAIADPGEVPALIGNSRGPVALSLLKNGVPESITLSPKPGIVSGRAAIGIAVDSVGTLSLPFFEALGAGFNETVRGVSAVFRGIVSLIAHAATLSANLSGVAGPVGIAGLAGDAARFGLGSLLSFAALISVNLGVINLFPFPALDGGRLAFIGVETLSGKKVPASAANALNTIGFAVLIALMLAITAHDVLHLIS